MNIRTVPPEDPCGVAVLEAAAQAGLPTSRFNEGHTVTNGAGWFQINSSLDNTRMSSSHAYLHPIIGSAAEPGDPDQLLGQQGGDRGWAGDRGRIPDARTSSPTTPCAPAAR